VSTPFFYRHFFLEKVGFSLEGDQGHPRKGVSHTVHVRLLESNHKTVCTELDILTHHKAHVHTEKADRDSVMYYELIFDVDGITDDVWI
jgi:hypothetical protein